MKAKRILALVTLILIVIAIWIVNTRPHNSKPNHTVKPAVKK